jgi:predicted kinase
MYVLVGGWPGAGKSTLAAGLARELGLPLLAKDEIKEALMEAFGLPATIAASRRLGHAAVLAMLRVARGCPAAVLDSTWFGYTVPHLRRLSAPLVEVHCVVPVEVARARYRARAAHRHAGHLDARRGEQELWGRPYRPLGVGPVIEVDTRRPVDHPAAAAAIRAAATG